MWFYSISAEYNGSLEAAYAHIDDDRYDIVECDTAGQPTLDLSVSANEVVTSLLLDCRFISAQRIQELREQHRRHETDTGSTEYQVAGITERISHLTQTLRTTLRTSLLAEDLLLLLTSVASSIKLPLQGD